MSPNRGLSPTKFAQQRLLSSGSRVALTLSAIAANPSFTLGLTMFSWQPMPDCEAEERILRAVFEIEKMAGSWVIDLGKLKNILTGTDECHHDGT